MLWKARKKDWYVANIVACKLKQIFGLFLNANTIHFYLTFELKMSEYGTNCFKKSPQPPHRLCTIYTAMLAYVGTKSLCLHTKSGCRKWLLAAKIIWQRQIVTCDGPQKDRKKNCVYLVQFRRKLSLSIDFQFMVKQSSSLLRKYH